tara:strand:+ start:397 stop:591 length:195 start_codon:yes stop_codon:yes gene_type:complete
MLNDIYQKCKVSSRRERIILLKEKIKYEKLKRGFFILSLYTVNIQYVLKIQRFLRSKLDIFVLL